MRAGRTDLGGEPGPEPPEGSRSASHIRIHKLSGPGRFLFLFSLLVFIYFNFFYNRQKYGSRFNLAPPHTMMRVSTSDKVPLPYLPQLLFKRTVTTLPHLPPYRPTSLLV